MNYKLYAIAYRKGQGSLEFRLPQNIDFEGFKKTTDYLDKRLKPGDKKWMPKIGLGIGREQGTYQGRTLEPNILYSSFQLN